jgi:hypothetical protein
VSTALGLIAFAVYVLAVVGAAAAITWLVVRLTPNRNSGGSAGS